MSSHFTWVMFAFLSTSCSVSNVTFSVCVLKICATDGFWSFVCCYLILTEEHHHLSFLAKQLKTLKETESQHTGLKRCVIGPQHRGTDRWDGHLNGEINVLCLGSRLSVQTCAGDSRSVRSQLSDIYIHIHRFKVFLLSGTSVCFTALIFSPVISDSVVKDFCTQRVSSVNVHTANL